MIEVELNRPSDVGVFKLRDFIGNNLKEYGEPLRWAIVEVSSSKLRIEAVVVIN